MPDAPRHREERPEEDFADDDAESVPPVKAKVIESTPGMDSSPSSRGRSSDGALRPISAEGTRDASPANRRTNNSAASATKRISGSAASQTERPVTSRMRPASSPGGSGFPLGSNRANFQNCTAARVTTKQCRVYSRFRAPGLSFRTEPST